MLVSFVVVQVHPSPVERIIAQLSGTDTGATSRISGSSGGDFGARGTAQSGAQMDMNSKYRGAQGLDPEFIKSLEQQFASMSPPMSAFLSCSDTSAFDFGKSYFRDVTRHSTHQEKLPVSISLGIWMTLIFYLIYPAGYPHDGERRHAIRHVDVRRHLVGYAIPGFLSLFC